MATLIGAALATLMLGRDGTASGSAAGAGSSGAGSSGAGSSGAGRVSLGDVETRLRSLTSTASEAFEHSKSTAGAGAALAGVVLLAAVYLHGRRRGRRRASVLEIRKV